MTMHPTPLVRGDGPQRLADGSVFLPKPTQRQLALRTTLAEAGTQPISVELTGKIVLDPGSGGRVQAMITGRVEAPPEGIASLGQVGEERRTARPRIRPSAARTWRADGTGGGTSRRAGVAESASLGCANWRRRSPARTSMPQKPTCKACANARPRSVVPSATTTTCAPVSGVVAAANVVAGQGGRGPRRPVRKSSTRATCASRHWPTIRDWPQTSPPRGAAPARTGSASPSSVPAVPCANRRSRCSSASRAAMPRWPLNQPAEGHRADPLAGERRAATAAAIVKNGANQDIVWIKTAAELFQSRPVRMQALDGTRVAVVDGWLAAKRVVVNGAALPTRCADRQNHPERTRHLPGGAALPRRAGILRQEAC